MEQQVEVLRGLDDVHLDWWIHTLPTRTAAELAQDELASRGRLHGPDSELVTHAEWATAEAEADAAEDPHREITEHDLIDLEPDGACDTGLGDRDAIEQAKQLVQPPETLDLREITAHETRGADENTVRVPTADETSDAVNRATRAILEMRARLAAQQAWEADQERAAQLTRWHHHDRAADYGLAAGHDDSGMGLGY